MVYDLTPLATLKQFFACRIVILGLLKKSIKDRQDIKEFFTENVFLIHVIALNFFLFAQFLLNAHPAPALWLQKNKNWELEIKKDLSDWVMVGWLVLLSNTVNYYFQWQISSSQTSHSSVVCDRFGCNLWVQSVQNHARDLFQAFANRHLKSEQTPFLRQVVGLNLGLLLCTGFDSENHDADLLICPIFT